jgi:hypothetical protein
MIIAAAVFLLALRVLKRQAGEETSGPVNEAMPAMPKQEIVVNSFNTAPYVSPGNGLHGNFRPDHLVQVNGNHQLKSQRTKLGRSAQSLNAFNALATKPQSLLTEGQFMTQPQQTELLPGPPSTFSTEPVQTARTPHCSVPTELQPPSPPVPQQQMLSLTPTRLWEENSQEEMTDPLLEALMHQAQAGLYIVPRRVDEIHATGLPASEQ